MLRPTVSRPDLSWCQAPIWGPKTRFLFLSDSCGLVDVRRPLWQRTGPSFTTVAGPRHRSHSRSRLSRNSWYFIVSDSRLPPPPVGRVFVFTSPRNRMTQLNPQALGSLSVASYVSQDYGGGIRTRLHAGFRTLSKTKLLYDWRLTANQFVLASNPLRLTTRDFFFQLNPCRGNVSTELFPRNGCCTVACLHSWVYTPQYYKTCSPRTFIERQGTVWSRSRTIPLHLHLLLWNCRKICTAI
jgi:hypothetical protein